ncbi:hypothetical protein BH24ACT26_BH24ACT26_01710 [soil metagenome]
MVSDASPEPVDEPRARSGVVELQRALEVAREEAEVAHLLLGLADALAEVRTVEDTLDETVHIVPGFFGADRCVAASWDGAEERFVVRAASGFADGPSEHIPRLGGLPLLRRCLVSKSPVLVPDVSVDARGAQEEAAPGLGAYIAIPLIRAGQDFGALGLEFSEGRRFRSTDGALACGVARQVAVALANARRFNLLQDLRALGIRVGSKLRLQAVVSEVATAAAQLLHGAGGSLYFVDPSSRSLFAAATSGASTHGRARVDLADDPWNLLLRGETVRIDEGEDGGVVAVPVPGPGLGLLGAVFVSFDRPFTLERDEEEALSVLAAQSGAAIENAQRFERQRSVARSLQQGLVAMEPPELELWDIAAVYEPAADEAEIGGDFFDAFDLPDGRVALVVGDVSGKGAEAAAGTAMAKYMLRAFAIRNPAPASVLFHLNNALVMGYDEDRFTTLLYAVFDASHNRCQLALGGHPPPLVYRRDGSVVEVVDAEGALLGAFEDMQYEQVTFDLDRNDFLVAYTDGLVEARLGHDLYGRERLASALARHAPEADTGQLARLLLSDAKRFGDISDDTVVFVLGPKPGAPT